MERRRKYGQKRAKPGGGSENRETSVAEKLLAECQGSIACDKHHHVIAILLLLSVILESR